MRRRRSAETIADGTYPLSRTLYIYVNKAKAAANPAVAAYVDYYLADGTISTALETVPYVNLPADKLAASQAAWDASQVTLSSSNRPDQLGGPAGSSMPADGDDDDRRHGWNRDSDRSLRGTRRAAPQRGRRSGPSCWPPRSCRS